MKHVENCLVFRGKAGRSMSLCSMYATVVLEKEKELVVKVLDLMLFGSESPQ